MIQNFLWGNNKNVVFLSIKWENIFQPHVLFAKWIVYYYIYQNFITSTLFFKSVSQNKQLTVNILICLFRNKYILFWIHWCKVYGTWLDGGENWEWEELECNGEGLGGKITLLTWGEQFSFWMIIDCLIYNIPCTFITWAKPSRYSSTVQDYI